VQEGRAGRARGRRGAVTALITIEGFRDVVEIGYEHRFEQHPGVVRAAYSSVN
jgi:N-methylhydantoinase A/oxoprolinase/acetone carboxylase beta subunit